MLHVAAELKGVSDSGEFVREITIKPVTLQFLIGSWLQNNSFPTKLLDLYREGCRRLCEEDNPSRRSSHRFQQDTNLQFATAARIAALTQLGNRFAIWKGRPSETTPEEDVPLHLLAGGNYQGIPITESVITNTFDAGLFSARGIDRIGWAHLTYAEFLTSVFCKEQRISLPQSHDRRRTSVYLSRSIGSSSRR